jgi:hypothetical protein
LTVIIIILVISIIASLLFFKKEKTREIQPIIESPKEAIMEEITEEQLIQIDESGRQYKNINKTRETPRRTYLFGTLHGKYWGELDEIKEQEYQHTKFYDFNIYEIEVSDTVHQCTPFNIAQDARFPRERLPSLLPIVLKINGKEYALNIHEPEIINVRFNRKLHQNEGSEIFGTIDAAITGYVLDFTTEEYTEREYIQQKAAVLTAQNEIKYTQTLYPTGKVEYNANYKRTEYYYSDYKNRYWSNWIYTKPIGRTQREGCLSSGLGFLGIITGCVFLLLLLPRLIILLPLIILLLLFGLIPALVWQWIFRILGSLLLLTFIFSLINSFSHPENSHKPNPILQNKPEERNPKNIPIVDTISNEQSQDTLIMHYRSWKDYEGNLYEGNFWVKKSDYLNAKKYKINLSVSENSRNSYDSIVYLLKENDKRNLTGLYQLFDSLKIAKSIDSKSFAEMVVCFVQDIPYTIVLPGACDPNLYADNFIRNYLSVNDAKCDGHEKFGINTPVEFMATLQGDCDTRTLLLYTIFAHYGYDVILMSSEFYNHSLIGINLSYEGAAYSYNDQRYVLWETTDANIKPGILPNEISNTNYWRISLKSK